VTEGRERGGRALDRTSEQGCGTVVRVVADRTGTDPDADLHPRLVSTASAAVFLTVCECHDASDREIRTLLVRDSFALLGAGLPAPIPTT
jgi:hypothetical protein